jgi:hypothetical protein
MTRDGDDRSSNEESARPPDKAKRGIKMTPQRRRSPVPKPKERPASKGRVHMGKTRN